MEKWQEAFWLAKTEWKASIKNFLIFLVVFVISFLLIKSTIPGYLEEASMGLDFFYTLTFSGFLSQLARPKDFQLQKYRSIRYAAPFLTALNQLPIQKGVIIKYRFLTYLFLLIMFNGLLLLLLYPAFQQEMTLSSYLSFSLIWFCFGIYIGCVTPAFEAGSNVGWNIFYGLIIGPCLFFVYIFVFYKWYNDGLVSWTIEIANKYPILSITISLILSIIGWKFWMNIMLQKINRTDYL